MTDLLDSLLLSRSEIRRCVGCGNEFEVTRSNSKQLRCKDKCGLSHHSALAPRLNFIGLDGEGIDISSGHEYVLLSIGNKSLHHDGARLSTHDIFTFLYEQYMAHRNSVFVGFSLGYDFSQWFQDLDEECARELLTQEGIQARQKDAKFRRRPVFWRNFRLDMVGSKQLRLINADYASYGWMYINDVFPFFQKSLLKSIDPKSWPEPIVSDEEYATLKAGKDRRHVATFNDDMIQYNVLENAVLARMMQRLDQGFRTFEVKLDKRDWYGPGRAAQAWLDNIDAPNARTLNREVIGAAREAGRSAYYGGWFEIFVHGLIPGTSYEYDINSAYPHIISQLPCLLHGTWTKDKIWPRKPFTECPVDEPYTLIYAEVLGRDRVCGAAMHRRKNGNILRPRRSKGWFWQPEIEAAFRAGVISEITMLQTVQYDPCECPLPYGAIADLYAQRLEVGKNSPQGIGLKLVYNSAYGKMAQTIGLPKYSNGIYASLITSGCRTMILDAIATHPDGVNGLLMIATDGVTFRNRHPSLPLSGNELGKWEETFKQNLSLFMPGVYWDDKGRAAVAAGELPSIKSRGISPRDIAKQLFNIDRMWETWEPTKPWPTVSTSLSFSLISPRAALARNDWTLCGRVEHDKNRLLDAYPGAKRQLWRTGKRNIPLSTVVFDSFRNAWASESPLVHEDEVSSVRYTKDFGYEQYLQEIILEEDWFD